MPMTGLSRKWEKEKLEAMSIEKPFAQLCYKGQERNEVIAEGRSGVRRTFFNIGEMFIC